MISLMMGSKSCVAGSPSLGQPAAQTQKCPEKRQELLKVRQHQWNEPRAVKARSDKCTMKFREF